MSTLNDVRIAAQKIICLNYEHSPDPREFRAYHTWDHTVGVHYNFVRLANAVRHVAPEMISDEYLEAGEGAAYAHDVDQTCIYVQGPHGTMRKRFPGLIEAASAMWLVRVTKTWTQEQKEAAIEAIMGTVPKLDSGKKRLTQPNLTPGVKITTVLLALADLGDGVMGGPLFAKRGRLMFIEDHIYVLDALTKHNGQPPNSAFLAQQMIDYLGGQNDFLKGVQDRIEEELLPLIPEKCKDAIRSVCTGTQAAHQASLEVWEQAAQMADRKEFTNIFRFMGYRVDHG